MIRRKCFIFYIYKCVSGMLTANIYKISELGLKMGFKLHKTQKVPELGLERGLKFGGYAVQSFIGKSSQSEIVSGLRGDHNLAVWCGTFHHSTFQSRHGTYEADRKKIYRWQGPEEAVGHQGCSQERPGHRRCEETTQIQARNRRSPRDPSLPEEHRAPHQETAIPASCP
jgi:hypothetical protein